MNYSKICYLIIYIAFIHAEAFFKRLQGKRNTGYLVLGFDIPELILLMYHIETFTIFTGLFCCAYDTFQLKNRFITFVL